MWTLQRACEVQCQAAALGGYDIPLTDEIREACKRDSAGSEHYVDTSAHMFAATVRKMERARRGPGWIDYRS